MNDAVVITLIGAVSAVIGIVIRYLFYSKCNKVKCCGCEIERDTIHEETNPDNNRSNRGAEQFEIKTTPNDNKV
jgi:hypothetical protein